MSDSLRGLTLNFANIAKLHRWAGFNFFKQLTAYCAKVYSVLKSQWEILSFITSVMKPMNLFMIQIQIFCLFLSFFSSLGQSVESRRIYALEITSKPEDAKPSKPKIRFVAGLHGNAPVGTELLLEFATFLCINYHKNTAITKVRVWTASSSAPTLHLWLNRVMIQKRRHVDLSLTFFLILQLINETRIFIVPSVNPDGREQASEKQCTSTLGLVNSNGVDLDRDFFG